MSKLPGKKRIGSTTLIVVSVVVLLVGIVASGFTYLAIDRSGRQSILDRARTMTAILPTERLSALSGDEQDLERSEYKEFKRLLTDARAANSDVRFIYLISKQGDNLVFLVDSEPASSEDYSPPGQVYDEAPLPMRESFRDGIARSDGPTRDRWGVWVSGYVPVTNAYGEVDALLGIDLPADDFITDALAYASLPFLVALMIFVVLLAAHRVRLREERTLEQRAEFLSIASHEIRTPLTGVRWALEDVLSTGKVTDGETARTLGQVHTTAVNLVERINNLLSVTKLEQRGKLNEEIVDMRGLLEEVMESFALAASQKKVSLVLDGSVSSPLLVRTDPGIVRHVFFNLLSNAIKYTKDGTTVEVRYEEGKDHTFVVNDEGTGVPQDARDGIFEGYHRAQMHEHAGIEGTGLGLYLVRKALSVAGGRITLRESDRGASFAITLPKRS